MKETNDNVWQMWLLRWSYMLKLNASSAVIVCDKHYAFDCNTRNMSFNSFLFPTNFSSFSLLFVCCDVGWRYGELHEILPRRDFLRFASHTFRRNLLSVIQKKTHSSFFFFFYRVSKNWVSCNWVCTTCRIFEKSKRISRKKRTEKNHNNATHYNKIPQKQKKNSTNAIDFVVAQTNVC